jgi:hypothetical protein
LKNNDRPSRQKKRKRFKKIERWRPPFNVKTDISNLCFCSNIFFIEGRKRREGRGESRKDGRTEGRKDGMKEGRKEGRKEGGGG